MHERARLRPLGSALDAPRLIGSRGPGVVAHVTDDILTFLDEIDLFKGLDPEIKQKLLAEAAERNFAPGELIIQEGAEPDFLYVLLAGEVAVLKRSAEGQDLTILTVTGPAAVGEFALFDLQPRSTTVKAIGAVRLLAFDIHRIRANQPLFAHLTRMNARRSSMLLRSANDGVMRLLQDQLAEARKRAALGVLFVNVVSGLALYTACLANLVQWGGRLPGGLRGVSIGILLVFGLFTLAIIHRTRFPLSFFGVTLNGWQKALREGVVLSIPLMLVLTVLKLVAIRTTPPIVHGPLFSPFREFSLADGSIDWKFYTAAMLAYTLAVPLQELIARGLMQSSLQKLLDGPRWKVTLTAILTSNLLFAAAHSHLGILFPLSVLIPGLYWGWMYARHRTILGVVVSHILVGNYALFGLGVSRIS